MGENRRDNGHSRHTNNIRHNSQKAEYNYEKHGSHNKKPGKKGDCGGIGEPKVLIKVQQLLFLLIKPYRVTHDQMR